MYVCACECVTVGNVVARSHEGDWELGSFGLLFDSLDILPPLNILIVKTIFKSKKFPLVFKSVRENKFLRKTSF